MFSTTRLSPALMTAGADGGPLCAVTGKIAVKIDANKIAERRYAVTENTRLTIPPYVAQRSLILLPGIVKNS